MCILCWQILMNVHLTMIVSKCASIHLAHMDAAVTQVMNSIRMKKLVSVSTAYIAFVKYTMEIRLFVIFRSCLASILILR